KFHTRIEQLFSQEEHPETNEKLIERSETGAKYFINEQKGILAFLLSVPIVTDSRLHAREINDTLKEIFIQLSMKQYLLNGFSGKFDIDAYHRRKRNFIAPPFPVNTYAGVASQRIESPHPALYQLLKKSRDVICAKADLPIYVVAGSNTLDEMARYLPQTL